MSGRVAAPAPHYLRPQTFGSILRSIFQLYRNNFLVLLILYGVPQFIFNAIIVDLQLRGSSGAAHVLIAFVAGLFAIMCIGPVSIALSEACLGLRPTVRRASSRAAANGLWRLPIVSILSMFASFAAMLLLFLPGLIVAARLTLAVPVLVLEGLAPFAALKRSWHLTKGYTWRNLAYLLGVVVIFYLCAALVLLTLALAVTTIGEIDLNTTSIIWSIAVTFCAPLLSIFPVLLYYDMRVRKEDYNVEALEQDLLT